MRAPRSTVLLASAVGAIAVAADQRVPFRCPQVLARHLGDQLGKRYARLPAKPAARLGRVADQRFDLGGTEIAGIDAHDRLPGPELARRALGFEPELVDYAAFFVAGALPAQQDAQ